MSTDLTAVRKWPHTCDEEVNRRGELQPCERLAVAVRLDPREKTPYPVCAFHARGPEMVPLSDLLAATA